MQANAVGIMQAELNRARRIIKRLRETVRPAKPSSASSQGKTTKKVSRWGCSPPRLEDVYANSIIQRARQ
jgi:hypothetical protein